MTAISGRRDRSARDARDRGRSAVIAALAGLVVYRRGREPEPAGEAVPGPMPEEAEGAPASPVAG